MVNSGRPGTNRAYLHSEDVAKAAGLVIFHGQLFHDQKETIPLKVSIIVTKGQQLFDAGKFEILKEIGVMDEALPIGFVVADPNFAFVIWKHCSGGLKAECTGA